MALKYYIEWRKLRVWGDEFRIDDDDSPLLRESRQTRILIAGILAEIKATHDLAQKYVLRYDMPGIKMGLEATSEQGGEPDLPDAVAKVYDSRKSQRQTHRAKWAARDKPKFNEIVERMRSLNVDLYELVRRGDTPALASTLATYLLPELRQSMTLAALQQGQDVGSESLSQLAKMQLLHEGSFDETCKGARRLTLGTDITLFPNQCHSEPNFGVSSLDHKERRSVLVEWRNMTSLDPNVRLSVDEQLMRAEALTCMLMAPKPLDLRIPECLGLVHDKNDSESHKTVGTVFAFPHGSTTEDLPPRSLLNLLLDRGFDMSTLNDRFALAHSLASALSALHAAGWYHRAFRSEHIVFFPDADGKLDITTPYIIGLHTARASTVNSIDPRGTRDAARDIYYHPDVQLEGFSRENEIYSLGVVMFEIARWASAVKQIAKSGEILVAYSNLPEMREWIVNSVDQLGAQVGTAYQEAVRACLTGSFGTHEDQAEDFGMSRAFFLKVIKALSAPRI